MLRRFNAALIALLFALLTPLLSLAADDDISRLYNFTSGTTIQSSQVNGEFNQLITTMNGKVSRTGVNTVSGNNTFSGTNTHSGAATFSNTLSVTGQLNLSRTTDPSSLTDGDFWYNSTSDVFKGRINGTTQTIGGSPFHSGFISGRYYLPHFLVPTISVATTAGLGADGTNTMATPFYVGTTTTFDRIACQVTTAVGSSTVHLSIYNNGSTGLPTTRLVDAGTVDSSTTGVKEATISATLTPGWYWLALRVSSASVALASISTTSEEGFYLLGSAAAGGSPSVSGTTSVFDSADTPATFTTSPTYVGADDNDNPIIWLRAQ